MKVISLSFVVESLRISSSLTILCFNFFKVVHKEAVVFHKKEVERHREIGIRKDKEHEEHKKVLKQEHEETKKKHVFYHLVLK
jgi:hypothetical protein